jgi:hypothetical protein
VYSSPLRILPAAVALLLLALPAAAQFPRDDQANRKIREAIDSHYLATDFDKAEALLIGTIDACKDKCSPQVVAKAWMYVGIVRGSGKANVAGAKQAFERAVALDRSVKLDLELATPDAQKAFQDAGGSLTPPEPTEAKPAPAATPAGEGEAPGLICTPKVTEVETRRAIPVECRSEREAASLELRFRPAGEEWQSLKMTRKDDSFRAEIPCDKTHVSGPLKLFVRAKDASGDEVARWGTKDSPIQIGLVEASRQEPPSFDDADPPQRCEAKEDCPPNFPGCKPGGDQRGNIDWGGACDNSSECKAGLLCLDGTCEPAPTCETDDDCPAGTCQAGKCDIGRQDSGSLYAKNWFGVHVAQDLAFAGGSDICTQDSQNNDGFACYYAGSRTGAYVDDPYPGATTDTSLVLATTRILLSYDRALTSHWVIGARVGYAFGGGPPSGRDVVYNDDGDIVEVVEEGLSFLPYHVEARVSYWFGANALGRKGFRPYAHAGGGLAQVDAKVVNSVKDCGLLAPFGTPDYIRCANGDLPADDPRLRTVELDAWKKLGQGFVTVGGGVVYAFTNKLGAQLNLNLMYTLPESGIVIEPSLGGTMGF